MAIRFIDGSKLNSVEEQKSDFSIPSSAKFPIVNDPSSVFPGFDDNVIMHPFGRRPDTDFNTLINYVKGSPEMVALLTAICDDVLSDGWKLYTEDNKSGRNKKQRAERFLSDNNAKEVFYTFLMDALITGNAYIYKKPGLTSDFVKKSISNIVNKMAWEYKSKSWNNQLKETLFFKIMSEYKSTDEDIFSTREFTTVPSSTMQANYDMYGNVKQWVQRVGTATAIFYPSEIIHYRYMVVNGGFYGFSPIISMINEMDILLNVKDYARYFFEKGGVPPFIFTFENETPNSPTFKEMRRSLQLYGQLTNKYKSLVLTGKVNVIPVQPNNKDMEFRQLAIYLTQVMIMVWGVPPARLPNLVMSEGARSDATSMDGYYRKISHIQDILEYLFNKYLLDEFGVTIKFNRTYKQDEVRENQNMMLKTDLALKLFNAGVVKDTWVFDYLNIEERDRDKIVRVDIQNNRQGALPNAGVLDKSPEKAMDDKIKQSKNIESK